MSGLAGAIIAAIIIGLYLRSDTYLRKQLRTHLQRVDTTTASFSRLSDIEPGQEITSHDTYRQNLSHVSNDCKNILKLTTSRPRANKDLATKLKATNRLCTDLTKVTTYSGNLYRFLDPLLRTQTTNLPDLGSERLKANLTETKATIKSTQQAIKTLDTSFVADPAVPEINTLLDELTRLSEAITDPSDAATVNTLYSKLQTDQRDFLYRRAYFWNNTVRLDQLHTAIQKQLTSYK
jgi:hypothetical protein